jgi:hypothetical protein
MVFSVPGAILGAIGAHHCRGIRAAPRLERRLARIGRLCRGLSAFNGGGVLRLPFDGWIFSAELVV